MILDSPRAGSERASTYSGGSEQPPISYYGEEPAYAIKPNKTQRIIDKYLPDVKEIGIDYGKRIATTYVVATAFGFNPIAAVAYTTGVFIIGKITKRAFHWKVTDFNDKIANRMFYIGAAVSTGALFLRYGFVPQYALTLLGIERLAHFLKHFFEKFVEDAGKGFRSWDKAVSDVTWKTFITEGFVVTSLTAAISYGIARLTGMNPVAAATYSVATLIFDKVADLILEKVRHPDCVDESKIPIKCGLIAYTIHIAYGITRIHTAAYVGINTVAYKVAYTVVNGGTSL